MKELTNDIENISKELASRQKKFDEVMDASRQTIRTAGLLITMLHNGKIKEAKTELAKAQLLSNRLKGYAKAFDYHTKQAQQEYAEAKIFFDIKTKKKIPSMSEVGVDGESYLMGLMDVVGELKRELVGALSQEDEAYAKFCHSKMLEIFDSTRSVRFAEAVLQGFRKKQDVARIQIENSASDLLHFGRSRRK